MLDRLLSSESSSSSELCSLRFDWSTETSFYIARALSYEVCRESIDEVEGSRT